ncbi:hypothetical protein M9Y10_015934 [Tritrichomonas musculus]|uniref:Transmembrane protein n=1 Tax=Tritrichomonas musculus TaxID=1915356 RepID=A0ABR2I633_9EUKA
MFSKSFYFSNSNQFSESNEFTQTQKFSPSYHFSNSDYFDSIFVTHLIAPSQTPKKQKATISIIYSLTYLLQKSVSFSFSYDSSNHNYSYYPYIIEYLSPSYSVSNQLLILNQNKKISSEKLIGIVCGSVAIFFLIISFVIFIIRWKNEYNIFINEEISFSSSSFEENKQTKSFETPINDNQNIDDLDNWL